MNKLYHIEEQLQPNNHTNQQNQSQIFYFTTTILTLKKKDFTLITKPHISISPTNVTANPANPNAYNVGYPYFKLVGYYSNHLQKYFCAYVIMCQPIMGYDKKYAINYDPNSDFVHPNGEPGVVIIS